MSEVSACQRLHNFLERHAAIVQWTSSGVFLLDYKTCLLKLAGLVVLSLVTYVLKHYPYVQTTVVGNTVYSRVVAVTLARFKVPHRFCKGTNRIVFYETQDGKEIPFEGPGVNFFLGREEDPVNFTPCSPEQLTLLSQHTGFDSSSKLSMLQNSVLHELSVGAPMTIKEFLRYDLAMSDPVLKIVGLFGGKLFQVVTATDTWLSSTILSDIVAPLQINDVVTVLYPKPTLLDLSDEIGMVRKPGYLVNFDLSVSSLNHEFLNDYYKNECILYSLRRARPFAKSGFFTVHPFHFPGTWDPFLTIMILTLGLIT